MCQKLPSELCVCEKKWNSNLWFPELFFSFGPNYFPLDQISAFSRLIRLILKFCPLSSLWKSLPFLLLISLFEMFSIAQAGLELQNYERMTLSSFCLCLPSAKIIYMVTMPVLNPLPFDLGLKYSTRNKVSEKGKW